MIFSQLSETLAPSEILKIGNLVKQALLEGEALHNFTIGDFDPKIFPIPKLLEESIIGAYREHLTSYPLAEGNFDLRKSIREYISVFQDLHYDESEILVASGGRPLIFALYFSLCDPGDRVIYPVPSWNNNCYTHFVKGSAVVIETREENHFMPTPQEIEPHLSTATLLTLCSPQNPAGTLFRKDDLWQICEMVVKENLRRGEEEKKLYVLFDQLYSQLIYGQGAHYNPVEIHPGMRPYTITVDAISKSFAATGVRVGWCMGPKPVIEKMKVLLTHVGAWAPMPEQKGVAAFLRHTGEVTLFLNRFRVSLHARLEYLYLGILQLKEEGYPVDAIVPEGAVFLSVKIELLGQKSSTGEEITTAEALTAYLLKEAKIAVVPFYAFGSLGNPCWFRLSIGTCRLEEIDDMITSLRRTLDLFPIATLEPSTDHYGN